jgi:hypothetical protein
MKKTYTDFTTRFFIVFQKMEIAKKGADVPAVRAFLGLIVLKLANGNYGRIQQNHYSLDGGEVFVGSLRGASVAADV